VDDTCIDWIILELILNGMGGHGLESCGTSTFWQICYGICDRKLSRKVDRKTWNSGMASSVMQLQTFRFLSVAVACREGGFGVFKHPPKF